jgi:O-antigen/teichoic acid export membrane protein
MKVVLGWRTWNPFVIFNQFASFFSKGSERSNLAKKQILYSFFLKAISVVIGLLFVPLLLHYLDAERYGIWLTLTSIVGWFTFFDAGLGNGLRNRLTEALAQGEQQLAKEYVSTTYAIISIIFIVVLIVFYCVNPFLHWNEILNTSLVPAKELSLLALIVFTFFLLRFIFQLIGIILMADQRPALNNAFGPIGNIVSLILIYILSLTMKGAFVIMGFVLSIVPVIVLLIATFFLFRKRYRYLAPSIKNIKWEHTHSLLGLGVKFFLIQIASIILFTSSNMIITQILGAEQVAVYNIAFKYFQVPVMLYGIIMTPIWSAVTDAYFRKDFAWLKNTLTKLNKFSLLVFVGIIFMLIASPYVFSYWVGKKIDIPFAVSATMALYAAINVFLSPYSQYINGMGKLYLSTRLVVIIFIVYIPLAIILAKSPLQLAGVMLATCIINILNIPFEVYQTNKLINQKAHGIWNK